MTTLRTLFLRNTWKTSHRIEKKKNVTHKVETHYLQRKCIHIFCWQVVKQFSSNRITHFLALKRAVTDNSAMLLVKTAPRAEALQAWLACATGLTKQEKKKKKKKPASAETRSDPSEAASQTKKKKPLGGFPAAKGPGRNNPSSALQVHALGN